jgi:hypothetical protein
MGLAEFGISIMTGSSRPGLCMLAMPMNYERRCPQMSITFFGSLDPRSLQACPS